MLIRSWNLFHGNSDPPQRRGFLDEMLRIATADDPDVLCVQEVPAWALGRFSAGDVAARPRIGPLPITAEIGGRLTALNHGLLRSAFSGQGNGILLAARLRILGHSTLTLNPRSFRGHCATELGISFRTRLAWAKERRVVQALRVANGEGRTFLVANMHCTSNDDKRLPDAELLRAARFATTQAKPEDVVVLAGDFNLTAAAPALVTLASGKWGFSAPGPGIDHVLVRGASATPVEVWPEARRTIDGVVLSDHAPVEVAVE
ncbi:MAG TPA: endonuclease/exonuclease/phosphatase family protein [Gaiellaceae bacterium]|nr:endonuclease/exonuclease/phosphatase family protein [Gaiellaceae bacterium]